MMTTLRAAARRGATIVAVNPLREVALDRFAHPQKPLDLFGGVAIASHFVQVQIGGDHAFFQGVCKAVLEHDLSRAHVRAAAEDDSTVARGLGDIVDLLFIAERTEGFAAWREHVLATPWPRLVEGSGVDEATMRAIARLYVDAKAVIACWAMGLTQHKHAVVTIEEIVNLMLLRGNIGRPGAGLCPVRGHSNVQGDRTMGIYHLPRPAFLDALGARYGFAPPRVPGHDTVEAIHALEDGHARAFVALGGNFVSAVPETERAARALERCALTASVSTKLNRTHLHPGARAARSVSGTADTKLPPSATNARA
jgi:anaerobic selenocysteine-containing dehydrogenase